MVYSIVVRELTPFRFMVYVIGVKGLAPFPFMVYSIASRKIVEGYAYQAADLLVQLTCRSELLLTLELVAHRISRMGARAPTFYGKSGFGSGSFIGRNLANVPKVRTSCH